MNDPLIGPDGEVRELDDEFYMKAAKALSFRNRVIKLSDGYAPNCVPFRSGNGYRDMRPNFITDDDVFLEGFSENGVTYQSHNFWVRFEKPNDRSGWFGGEIFVKHGGGVESLGLEYHTARGLKSIIDSGDLKSAFHLCWGLVDLARRAREMGQQEAKTRVFEAFVDGRLKKRKQRGTNTYRVEIEPKQGE